MTNQLRFIARAAALVWAASLFLPVTPVEGPNFGWVAVLEWGLVSIIGPFFIVKYLTPKLVLRAWVGLGAYLAVPASAIVARLSYRVAAKTSAIPAHSLRGLIVSPGARSAVARPFDSHDERHRPGDHAEVYDG